MYDKSSAYPRHGALEPRVTSAAVRNACFLILKTVLERFWPADFGTIFGNPQWDTLPDLPWIRGISGSSHRHRDFPGEDHRSPDQSGTQVRSYLIKRHSFGNPAHIGRVALPGHWVAYLIFPNLLFNLGLSIQNCFVFALASVL